MHFPMLFGAGRIFALVLRCLIPLLWLILTVIALFGLRKQTLGDTARVLWAILIICVPVIGALAYWIVRPGDGSHTG